MNKHIIIIGSGIAGVTCADKIRALSPEAKITLLTKEIYGYYSRPLLSHGFSKPGIEQSIILKPFSKLLENNICIISGVAVTEIERSTQTLTVSGVDGRDTLHYDKLILATGSAAFIPPPLRPFQEHFFLLNSLHDLKQLRRFRQPFLDAKQQTTWAIIGGGLIGCEVASDLAVSGDAVTLYHMMDRLMERQLQLEDSATLLNVLQESKVDILLEQLVQEFAKQDGKLIVKVAGNNDVAYDGVIVSCGFQPRKELAVNAGLDTGRGIKVNQHLQTSDENIFALGDVAELPNGKLYAFILPIRNQALWLAGFLCDQQAEPWSPPKFKAKAKVHGFEAVHPYIF